MCFMAVITAVTVERHQGKTRVSARALTAMASTEFLLSDEQVSTLIIVAQPAHKRVHVVLLHPGHLPIPRMLPIPRYQEAHDMLIREPVRQIRPVLLVRPPLAPAHVHAVRVLPLFVHLEVFWVARVDVREGELLAEGEDPAGVDHLARRGLGRAEGVRRAHVLSAREGGEAREGRHGERGVGDGIP